MPIDTSAITSIRQPDVMEAFARAQQMRGMQQENELRKLQMKEYELKAAEAERQAKNMNALRQLGVDSVRPGGSVTTNTGAVNVGGMELAGRDVTAQGPATFDRNAFVQGAYGIDPMMAQQMQSQFAQEDAASQERVLKLRKAMMDWDTAKLANFEKQTQMSAQLAVPLYEMEQQGASPEQLQQKYNETLMFASQNGLDVSQLPPQYQPGMAQQIMSLARDVNKAFEQPKAPTTVQTAEGVMQWGGKGWQKMGNLPKTVPAAVVIRNNGPGSNNSSDAKDIARAIIDGNQPPDINNLGRGDTGKVRGELARAGYNLTDALTDWKATQKRVASMNSTQQVRLSQAVDFTYHSLDVIDELYSEWLQVGPKSGYRVFNRASLVAAKNLPGRAGEVANALDAQINDLTAEMANVYMGGNTPTEQALKLASHNLKSEYNEQTFKRSIGLIRKNLQIRQNSIRNSSQSAGVGVNSYDQNQPPAQPQGGGDPLGIR
jgi:hypothetical protein